MTASVSMIDRISSGLGKACILTKPPDTCRILASEIYMRHSPTDRPRRPATVLGLNDHGPKFDKPPGSGIRIDHWERIHMLCFGNRHARGLNNHCGPASPPAGLNKPIGKVENRWEEYQRMWASKKERGFSAEPQSSEDLR